jgi:S1-C subfamily serine protease
LAFDRDGKVQKVTVALGFDPTGALGQSGFGRGGVAGARLGISADPAGGGDGVLIAQVRDGGAAAKAGIKVGDRIVEVAGKPVQGLPGLGSALSDLKPGDTVEVTIKRDGKTEKIPVKMEAPAGG